MASFILRQLAEQFWSVNHVTYAFGIRIPNISNQDTQKFTYQEITLLCCMGQKVRAGYAASSLALSHDV